MSDVRLRFPTLPQSPSHVARLNWFCWVMWSTCGHWEKHVNEMTCFDTMLNLEHQTLKPTDNCWKGPRILYEEMQECGTLILKTFTPRKTQIKSNQEFKIIYDEICKKWSSKEYHYNEKFTGLKYASIYRDWLL